MNRLVAIAAFTVLAVAPALAHPGHIFDDGYGHNHVMDFAIIGGAVLAAAGWGVSWLARRFISPRLAARRS